MGLLERLWTIGLQRRLAFGTLYPAPFTRGIQGGTVSTSSITPATNRKPPAPLHFAALRLRVRYESVANPCLTPASRCVLIPKPSPKLPEFSGSTPSSIGRLGSFDTLAPGHGENWPARLSALAMASVW